VIAADLGQVAPGGDAQLRRERLNEHGHQVAHQDDPEQEVTEAGAALDVGGEVARIDIGDARHERRPEEGEHPPDPAQPSGGALLLLPPCRGDHPSFSHHLAVLGHLTASIHRA